MHTNPAVTLEEAAPTAPKAITEAALAEAWFDAPPASSRRPSSIPPPPSVEVGEFIGDPLADGWLR